MHVQVKKGGKEKERENCYASSPYHLRAKNKQNDDNGLCTHTGGRSAAAAPLERRHAFNNEL